MILEFSLIIIGITVGIITSMVGLAGGIFYLPILIMIFGVSVETAISTSLFAMLGVTLSSSISYIIQKKVDFKLAVIYDLFDIPGVIIGAFLTTIFISHILLFICGIIIMFLAFSLFFHDKFNTSKKKKVIKLNKKHYLFASLSSFIGGTITGISGMGGGTTDTTTMILLGVPIYIAVGSSELAMLFTNIVGLIAHFFLGNFNYIYALPLFIGAFIGAQIGSLFLKHINTSFLKKFISIIAFFTGIRLLFA